MIQASIAQPIHFKRNRLKANNSKQHFIGQFRNANLRDTERQMTAGSTFLLQNSERPRSRSPSSSPFTDLPNDDITKKWIQKGNNDGNNKRNKRPLSTRTQQVFWSFANSSKCVSHSLSLVVFNTRRFKTGVRAVIRDM
ncbi:hypothetical protein AVEN_200244-1 [Araneus ventricosus]|uniref:Uncharacterized protein n=1 Tax=Araneus ventricosus TaxID=182803 RepID=A0A4Y2DTD9_ARAVE|nr:hypothetical protein AVEN_200244-1 [Araneus ventricosus]